jgi:hypothetical protein
MAPVKNASAKSLVIGTLSVLLLAAAVVGGVAILSVQEQPERLRVTTAPDTVPSLAMQALPIIAGVYIIQPGNEASLPRFDRRFCERPRRDQVMLCSA